MEIHEPLHHAQVHSLSLRQATRRLIAYEYLWIYQWKLLATVCIFVLNTNFHNNAEIPINHHFARLRIPLVTLTLKKNNNTI